MKDAYPIMNWSAVLGHAQFKNGRTIKTAVIDTGMQNDLSIGQWFGTGAPNDPVRIIKDWIAWTGNRHMHATWCGAVEGRGHGAFDNAGYWGGCREIRFYSYRVLDGNGSGSTGTVMAGIAEAIKDDVDQIGMSLGGLHDPAFAAAVKAATDRGIIVIVAAGNSGQGVMSCDKTLNCPADEKGAISIGATTCGHPYPGSTKEEVPKFSSQNPTGNPGNPYQHDMICAPGYQIRVDPLGSGVSGTSLARPFVSSLACALIEIARGLYPTRSKIQIAQLVTKALLGCGVNLGYKGHPDYTDPNIPEDAVGQPYLCIQGHGRMDAAKAIQIIESDGQGPDPDPVNPEPLDYVAASCDNQPLALTPKGNNYYMAAVSPTVGAHKLSFDLRKTQTQKTVEVNFVIDPPQQTIEYEIKCKVESPTEGYHYPSGSQVTVNIQAWAEKKK